MYRGRCPVHSRERERATARRGRGKYGTKFWQIRREQQLSRHPFCADPLGQHGDDPPLATVVHHVLGIEHDPRHRVLQSLCSPCHSALHGVRRGIRPVESLGGADNGNQTVRPALGGAVRLPQVTPPRPGDPIASKRPNTTSGDRDFLAWVAWDGNATQRLHAKIAGWPMARASLKSRDE